MRHDTPNPSGCKLGHSHARQRMLLGAQRLHRLGERALHEFLSDLAQEMGAQTVIIAKLEAWSGLDPATLAAVNDRYCGGRQFAPLLSQVPA